MTGRDVRLFLDEMAAAITDVSGAVEGVDFEAFLTDKMRQKAAIRDFEVLGEAATRVPVDIRKLAEDIPWRRLVAMRNELIHGYFSVDLGIVFATAKSDIPKLRLPLEALRARLDADD